ncbi:DUF397 domain-containing protein [Streptomyces xinghaiensis]|uniref:DUF397 domain-containing protein n=1 Tax=Streptomyces xinghaiensis TaxID=1038928 RepID=UPI000304CF58|nr:DUF397 domain-containing protein [Streptomyces xinghaiensis]MZE78381.1 DUF397 domain-containing protein [Streptomyces sp. SID5475]
MVEPWTWRKSSFSGENVPACVEVAWNGGQAMVRDSKSLRGPVLCFSPAGWQAFIQHLAAAPARSTPGSG